MTVILSGVSTILNDAIVDNPTVCKAQSTCCLLFLSALLVRHWRVNTGGEACMRLLGCLGACPPGNFWTQYPGNAIFSQIIQLHNLKLHTGCF